MPGPGGGGHGGGGGRGGSFGGGGSHGGSFGGGGSHGGSFGGGGFHGGPRPHHGGTHIHMGGWGWHPRPRHYGGGGGCCGGIMILPIVVLLFAVMAMLSMCNSVSYAEPENNGYDEGVFQDFADEQYAAQFGDSSCYEDNLLIVFLVDEDCYSYSYIAWVGDHVATGINKMLGNNDTELGQAMSSCINETNYKYSLDSNLAAVMTTMAGKIEQLGLESSLICGTVHGAVDTRLVNRTDLPMTQSTVDGALEAFAEATGIPTVIVVEDMKDVFGTSAVTMPSGSSVPFVAVVALVILIAVVVVLIYRRKNSGEDSADEERNKKYRQFDDQY